MTIEIDDSGTGDILGPALIIFWRKESNDLLVKEVPLEIYQSPDYYTRAQQYIRDLFVSVIQDWAIPPTEEIYLCTGSCFDTARQYLKEQNFFLHDAKIEGYLQTAAEEAYIHYLEQEYNIPSGRIPVASGRGRFFAEFGWLSEDFPRRKRWIKTGFEKWAEKWAKEAEQQWFLRMTQEITLPLLNLDAPPERRKPAAEKATRPKRIKKTTRKTRSDSPSNTRSPSRIDSSRRGSTSPRTGGHREKKSTRKIVTHRKGTGRPRRTSDERDHPKYSATNPDPKFKLY